MAELNLSDNAVKVMEMVEKMTVLELSDLVKALEEKFGVSAAAPVSVAAAATASDAPAVEEKDSFDVVLVEAGAEKIAVIKAVRVLDQNLGLVEAKGLVDKGNAEILKGVKKDVAEEAKKTLEAAGAKVELR